MKKPVILYRDSFQIQNLYTSLIECPLQAGYTHPGETILFKLLTQDSLSQDQFQKMLDTKWAADIIILLGRLELSTLPSYTQTVLIEKLFFTSDAVVLDSIFSAIDNWRNKNMLAVLTRYLASIDAETKLPEYLYQYGDAIVSDPI